MKEENIKMKAKIYNIYRQKLQLSENNRYKEIVFVENNSEFICIEYR